MKEADYYAPGSYNDPDAPWNEPYIPEKDFDVCISQTLSKSTQVTTNKYQPYIDEEDGYEHIDTDNIVWKEIYEEQHYTPEKIIEICKNLAELALKEGLSIESVYLPDLIRDCNDWIVDETTVIEE